MLGIHDLWFFIVSGLLLNITPGPDTAYIVGAGGAFASGGQLAMLRVFAAASGFSR